MEVKHIKIHDYNYPLPDERIAKFPLVKVKLKRIYSIIVQIIYQKMP